MITWIFIVLDLMKEWCLKDKSLKKYEQTFSSLDGFLNHRNISYGSFDVNIMEHLYTSLNRPFTWQYWQVRDSRTLFDFIDGQLDRTKHHDAVEDAIEQAKGVQRALRKIGWAGSRL